MLDKLISVLAPHRCVVCRAEGSLLCTWCLPDAIQPVPERCYRCYALSRDSAVCAACRKQSPLRHVWVRGSYEGAAKQLVHMLKFARAMAAAQTIGQLLHEATPALPPGTIITFVPTATSRVRHRGYDQAELIARAFAAARGQKVQTLLTRVGQTRQLGADRKHRLEQAAKNYVASRPEACKGVEILIIDDISTTGATLEAAAYVLKKAGARTVHAAVFAQKQ